MKQDHFRVLRANLIERVPDPTVIITVGSARKGDPTAWRE
jgi:hypothetical protein